MPKGILKVHLDVEGKGGEIMYVTKATARLTNAILRHICRI